MSSRKDYELAGIVLALCQMVLSHQYALRRIPGLPAEAAKHLDEADKRIDEILRRSGEYFGDKEPPK